MAALLCCALVLWSAAPAQAQQRELRAERMDVELTVLTSGALLVRERITYAFTGTWNGVYRTIPIRYEGPGEFDYGLDVDLRNVSVEGVDEELRVETSRQAGNLKWQVWVPGASTARRTVVFEYRVAHALRFLDAHAERYWNVIGDGAEVEFGPVEARVLLPAGVSGVRTRAFVGGYGAREESVLIDRTPGYIEFDSDEDLGWRRGMSIVVGWDPGVVERPTAADRAAGFVSSNIWLLLPLLAWFLMHRHWRARGKDPEERPITPQYEPPGGMGPAEAGTLVDHHPHIHDLTATIVDLAIRGYIRIEEQEPDGLISKFVGGTDYAFRRLPDPEGDRLRAYERRILDALFDEHPGLVTTDDLKYEFHSRLSGIRTAIFEDLVDDGYYGRRPDKVRNFWVVAGAVISCLGFLAMTVLASRGVMGPVTAMVAGVGTGIPVLIYGFFMPARTRLGARVTERIRGLEEFLSRVEQDRFRRMITTPEQFETLLPFAMALQVDEKWADAFDDLFAEPPDWYVGRYPGGGFRAGHLMSSLDSWSSETGSALTAAPRSSSGSSGGSSVVCSYESER